MSLAARSVRIPGPDHPISIEPNARRVTVRFAGTVIAESTRTLTLREAAYPPVHYIPIADVDIALLTRSDRSSYCPYKGEAAYYSIAAGGERSVDAVWAYEAPFESVAAIRGHVAFYPDRVDAIVEQAA